jgi:hypothetical protein
MQVQELVLRDVHVPAAPSLWPPAPGWWLVAVVVLVLVAVIWLLRWRHARKIEARQRLFEDACRNLPASAQVAAMSELLRRAARQVDKQADKLQGDAWLKFLDGKKGRDFSEGAGRLLLEGGYRRDVDASELANVKALARTRFLELMARKP